MTNSQAFPGFSGQWDHCGNKGRDQASLQESYRSIPISSTAKTPLKRFLSFVGPGYLVAVGYMDPGNWSTSLAGGSTFGYQLLFVVLLSNVMAVILQSLCARLAVGSGRDLAQACKDAYPSWVSIPLWLLAEGAIIATDLAEVIGTAIGLNLLFGIPLEIGVVLTALDVFFVLYLQTKGFRWIEAFIITLLGIISVCFIGQIALADPNWADVIAGFAPTKNLIQDPNMLYLALGIIGATVMPHNLYLHSGIVQTRAYDLTPKGRHEAIKYSSYDSAIALCLALLINGSILVLAAAAFHEGHQGLEDLDVAYQLLNPLLGSAIAPILFGVALLASGLSSTITATMAGQIVMEGFINFRLPAWQRRLITRALAILPATAVIFWLGADQVGKLLILSQVVLSLQLPFAIVPLVMFTADRKKMGEFVAPRWITWAAGVIAIVVIVLNIQLLYEIAGL